VLVRLLLDRPDAAVAGEVAAPRTTIPMGSGGVDNAAPPGEAAATGQGAARVLGRWETSLGQAARRIKDGMSRNGVAAGEGGRPAVSNDIG
jgi:hypothetical protein